jgi:hypothetical protein
VFPEALSKISLILFLPEGSDWPLQLGLFAKSGVAEQLILRRVLFGITEDDLDRWTLVRLRSLHLFDVILLLLRGEYRDLVFSERKYCLGELITHQP